MNIKAERPAGWIVHQSGSCKSSEAYWMVYDHRSGSGNSGESYREGFIQLKWKLMGCSFEQPFLYGEFYGAEASKLIYREYEIYPEPA